MINFNTLKRSPRPNDYLVADASFCPMAKADREPPTYDHPPETVCKAWRRVISQQPRTSETVADKASMTYEYIQRSGVMRFPDTITVRFAAQGNSKGTKVVVYSASKIGYSDWGVNARRVRAWLTILEQELGRQ